MDKSTKIIAALLVAIVAVFVVIVAVTTAVMNKDDTTTDVTVVATVSVNSDPTVIEQTAQTAQTQQAEQTSQVTTTAAPTLNEQILGKWTDSANMSGYEFFADGTVEMTYVNLTIPIINVPINGVSRGTYVLDGDKLTTKFSIYSATIDNTYTVSVANNSLTMRDREDGETATYARASSSSSVTTTSAFSDEGVVLSDEIVGSWVNDNSTVRYMFNNDSTVKVTYADANVPSISTSALNGNYNGVYLTDGSSIIIQFTVDGKKITQKFTFAVSRNTLSFTDESSNTDLFIREGTNFVSSDPSDLIGKWSDGVDMSGYEFKEGGIVEITYVNFTVPVINMPINGTFTGSYTTSDNTITISYSIYGNSVVDTFEYAIDTNSLTLTSTEGEVSTYIKR